MAKGQLPELVLPSVDDLFTTQEERDERNRESVKEISLDEISDFRNHPFKVKMDQKMEETTKSVKEYGVLVPAIVRPKPDGGYEMVAGHRRKKACELAGFDKIPCLVRDLNDDEATIIMVDSNLHQRDEILPSEKAFAYKMKIEAMKRQAGRPKINGAPVGPHLLKGKSRDILASDLEDSREQIRRYIRLTNLIPEILDMVDEKVISFRPAVEFSYLSVDEQKILYDTMKMEDCTPSLAQAIKMKKFSEEGKLSADVLESILQEKKPNQIEQFKMPKNRLRKYFPKGTTTATMEETIIKALDMYQRHRKGKER